MAPRERLADVQADRDEVLDKVEQLRNLADDILSEYEVEDDEDGNGDSDDSEDGN